MIATDHLLVGSAMALAMSKKDHGLVTFVLAGLTQHALLDFIPHFDPSNLGSNYLEFGTPAFWFATGDNVLGFGLVGLLMILIPRLRRAGPILLTFSAWFPDLYSTWVWKGWLTANPFMVLHQAHIWFHSWWRTWYGEYSPSPNAMLFGILTSLVAFALACWYIYSTIRATWPVRDNACLPAELA